MVCAFTANRDIGDEATGNGGADAFDIHRRPWPRGRPSDVRRRRALLPRLLNLARVELQEGLSIPRRATRTTYASTASRCFEGVSGIYGLAELPIAFAV